MASFSLQRQQNILVVSQPSSLVYNVSDTHTMTSPESTPSVVESVTASSSVATSNSGQYISTISTTGMYYVFFFTGAALPVWLV